MKCKFREIYKGYFEKSERGKIMEQKTKEITQEKKENNVINFKESVVTMWKNIISFLMKYKKYSLICIVGILLLGIVLGFVFSRESEVITISEASLKEIISASDLSTVEYTYNSIVTISNEKEEKYHVAYDGIVKAGFDFNQITVTDNQKEKKIIITIPEIKIISAVVNDQSLEFIFLKDKYDTETTYQEAYRESINDLKIKAEQNNDIKIIARENAIMTMKALIKPWEEQLPEGYTVECI